MLQLLSVPTVGSEMAVIVVTLFGFLFTDNRWCVADVMILWGSVLDNWLIVGDGACDVDVVEVGVDIVMAVVFAVVRMVWGVLHVCGNVAHNAAAAGALSMVRVVGNGV